MSRPPFFSICIPQYNRTPFVIEACRSLDAQKFRDFEVCISDDCSTDSREADLLGFLRHSSLTFVYQRCQTNGRYDANLRSAIALASGEYCFLLGNDDALKDHNTLSDVQKAIREVPAPDIVVTNFESYTGGDVTRRVQRTTVVGPGPRVAVARFRKFSFVSGIVLRRIPAQKAATTRWDGSEMYQMYLGCRLIASGGTMLEADLVTVRKDIHLRGEQVDSYVSKRHLSSGGIPIQRIPLSDTARLVIDAVDPYVRSGRGRLSRAVMIQYFGFLYPYWLLEYRRVQSWRFAAGVSRAMRPARSLAGTGVSRVTAAFAAVVYGLATMAGLMMPVGAIRWVKHPATRLARALGEWSAASSRS